MAAIASGRFLRVLLFVVYLVEHITNAGNLLRYVLTAYVLYAFHVLTLKKTKLPHLYDLSIRV